jgi:hypothetical protein
LVGYWWCWCDIADFGLLNFDDKALQSFETRGTAHQAEGTISEDLNIHAFIGLNW